MKITHLIAAFAFMGAAAAAISAQAAPSAEDFVTKASQANNFEIQSSKLALEKSGNDSVKGFAQHMIDDHTKIGEQLSSTLESSQSKAEPSDGLSSGDAKTMKKLQSLSGADFDKKYISAQTDAHKDAVKLFKSYAKSGDDTALKQFAAQTLPTLKQHLTDVKQIKSSL